MSLTSARRLRKAPTLTASLSSHSSTAWTTCFLHVLCASQCSVPPKARGLSAGPRGWLPSLPSVQAQCHHLILQLSRGLTPARKALCPRGLHPLLTCRQLGSHIPGPWAPNRSLCRKLLSWLRTGPTLGSHPGAVTPFWIPHVQAGTRATCWGPSPILPSPLTLMMSEGS